MDDIFQRLVRRDERRSEAEIQADVRQFILSAPFELDEGDVALVALESSVGNRQRIDVEVGATVIEVKRDLRRGRVKEEAIDQLAGYVELRMQQTGLRYVGVLTDGTEWCCYHLVEGGLREVSNATFGSPSDDLSRLVVWLEGVLATAKGIPPTPQNIEARLGARSSAYALDRATLSTLFQQNRTNPSVQLKRTLWSRLLTSALGTQFEDTDDLFIEHTLLVNTAEIIAHAVLGLSLEAQNPVSLLGGHKFDESGIYGVVEPDFFDWVIEVDGGERFVRTLAKRLGRFDWEHVHQDILKVLYESIIAAETRQRMGEYYTPDWLADVVVQHAVPQPLATRVLDPACGSGTFLFHAIRSYVEAAERDGMSVSDMLDSLTKSVIGMDLHPVAVTLARVTYLLAIGRERLTHPARGTIQIPVYLGDSLQWQEQSADLWAAENLVIRVDDKQELVGPELRFPDGLLDDAARFDQLVTELANRAAKRKPGAAVPALTVVFQRLAIPEKYRKTIEATFATMCRLHDAGRDHIWGYFVRNLARPLWLSREKNRVDVLIGNPPWLALRHMTSDMQVAFRNMSEARGLWAGAENATHQDLSGLFVIRAAELYLKRGGRFALVMPNAALDREHYSGFRRGYYGDATIGLKLQFSASWDLRRIRPHFFPRAACVAFGTRSTRGEEMTDEATIWSGRLPRPNAPWSEARPLLVRSEGHVTRTGMGLRSPYHPAFAQGAVLLPRFLFSVEDQVKPPLGLPSGKVAVKSSRSVQEKKPWKELPALEGVVESEFVRPYFNGENILPYLAGSPERAVIPCNPSRLLTSDEIEFHPGLQHWWERADALWKEHSGGKISSLRGQLDYQSKLSKQLPVVPLRVVYNRSGMHVVAAKVRDRRALIASGLYWAAVHSDAEANFLCAILNAPITTELVRPYMTYGKDERDVAKHIWELPIPTFDPDDTVHARLAELGQWAEREVSNFAINDSVHFSAVRRHIRQHLAASAEAEEINNTVFELLG
ncbi:MAG: restriction endonuclease [Mesorhizobium sp. 61-13]|nr:MAG: restriction endonuclease [Mesorhizobium sp. 61-13]